MYAAALEAGFSVADLKDMPFNRLVMVLRKRSESMSPKKDDTRMATQADIDKYL